MPEDWRHGGFGVYVHWPFCAAKCPYCDFNSHVRREVDQKLWAEALVREIQGMARMLPGREVSSIFFGGGTPSLMDPATVADVLNAIAGEWALACDVEISLEANPTSVEAANFRGYRDAGVNRISMGVQALNDPDLRALGRMHTVEEAMAAFSIARENFDRVSFDLICARQNQTLENWRTELTRALSLAVDHLSLYQLTIEPNTRFGDMDARGMLRGLPNSDLSADIYDMTQELCSEAGMPAYEISNHARPGAECRHNLVYWRYGDYVGIGPGAHGRITTASGREATTAWSNPEKWISETGKHGTGIRKREMIAPVDQSREMTLMGLRLAEGVNVDRYRELNGTGYSPDTLDHLSGLGLISQKGNRIAATPDGRAVLNTVLNSILNQ